MFTRPLRHIALAAFCLGLLSACSNVAPPMQRLPEMSFRHLTPITLDVGTIEVVSEFKPPAQAPHIEYDMPVTPEDALKRWVQDRLQPIGRTGKMRVVIHDASATEVPLKTDQGFTGMFKKEQAARVKMTINVSLQMLDERQMVTAEVSGKAMRERTTTEGLKLNEHDRILYDMVEDLMKGFNSEIDDNIRSNFGPWLGQR
jgi:hypothetical protein